MLTLKVTLLGWLLFRERDLHRIVAALSQSPFSATKEQWWVGSYLVVLLAFYTLPLVIHLLGTSDLVLRRKTLTWSELGLAGQTCVASLLVFGIVCARSIVTSEFIYFQF